MVVGVTMLTFGLFDIDAMRRRPAGPKVLVYLDQSAVSEMARGSYQDLLALLRRGIESDRLLCPSSAEHADESMLAGRSYWSIVKLVDELSMGVRFRSNLEIEYAEIMAAATSFLGRPYQEPLWMEAFSRDPHAPRSEIYGAGYRVTVLPDQVDWWQDEVAFQKSQTDKMTATYEEIRREGRTFEQQAELEYQAHLRWKLGPLIDAQAVAERLALLVLKAGPNLDDAEAIQTPGSAFRRYQALRSLVARVNSIRQGFPELETRAEEFARSMFLRSSPSLSFIPLFLAGLACIPGRKAKPSDRYDLAHLTKGLSRCDIVTADGGMVQMCKDRRLIPTGVPLFRSNALDELTRHLRSILM